MNEDYPVADVSDAQMGIGNAVAPDQGLTGAEFYSYMSELRWQPGWRNEADKAAEYYDGNQLDPDTLAALEKKGMGPLINNVIAPVVNVVLGMEAKTRADWRTTADDNKYVQVAEALASKLHESERNSRADRACADAYAGQVKAGLGIVEVSRSANPFEYPYRVENLHRREFYWDWRDQTPDLKRARFQLRKRWYDVDQAAAYFPDKKDLLQSAVGDPYRYQLRRSLMGTTLNQSFDIERGLDLEDFEQWRQMDRKRICFYEVWYRRWQRGLVFRSSQTDAAEFNPRNQLQVQLLNQGQAKLEEAVYSKMRTSIWAGPHKTLDAPSMEDHSPYVAFWGYREDRTGVPYGLIRSMISPQDEVNARRQKMMWLLGAKRLIADSDAIDLEMNDWATIMQELGRPDAMILLNKARMNRDKAFQVDDNLQLAREQFEVLQDAKRSVQEVVGVFNALLGDAKSGQSGAAINSLVEQGTTALAEINDNYRFAKRMVGERLLSLVREDLIGQQVTVETDVSGKRKFISLNSVMVDPDTQQPFVVNNVAEAKIRVALEDVPSTPSYRAQQFTMLSEVMKGMSPEMQAAIAPFWMEASDLQHKKMMADAMRKALGQNVDPSTPEEAQALAADQAAKAEVAQYQKAMAMADLEKRKAEAAKIDAEAKKLLAEIGGNPELDAHRDEARKAIEEAQAASKDAIDQMTVEIMTMRNGAALKEQQLNEKIAKAIASAHSAETRAEAENRRAEIEREIADLTASATVRVAELENARDKEADAMMKTCVEKIAALTSMVEKIAAEEKSEPKESPKEERRPEPTAPPVHVEIKVESGAVQLTAPPVQIVNPSVGTGTQVPTRDRVGEKLKIERKSDNVFSDGQNSVRVVKNPDGTFLAEVV